MEIHHSARSDVILDNSIRSQDFGNKVYSANCFFCTDQLKYFSVSFLDKKEKHKVFYLKK